MLKFVVRGVVGIPLSVCSSVSCEVHVQETGSTTRIQQQLDNTYNLMNRDIDCNGDFLINSYWVGAVPNSNPRP